MKRMATSAPTALVVGVLVAAGCGGGAEETETTGGDELLVVALDIEERLAQYSPTEITADLSHLSESEMAALAHLVAAARLMDDVFLRQVWVGNPKMADQVAALSEPAQIYYDINFGPWDRLAEMEPFIGSMPHPPGAGYYPVGMTKAEFEAWLAARGGHSNRSTR